MMLARLLAWLFGTAMGRGVLLGGSVSLGLALGWWAFSAHYDQKGYDRCTAEHLEAANKANLETAAKNAADNRTSSAIGRDTADRVGALIDQAGASATASKETIRYVYRDPPRTAPVALGSCVHPLDDRVQERIDDAVRRASRSP